MEDRILAIEKRQRILMILFLVLIVGPALLAFNRSNSQGSLEAESIKIVNSDGAVVAELAAGDTGGRLSIRTATGQEVVSVGVDELGGVLRVLQSDGRLATLMSSYKVTPTKTGGLVEVYDANAEAAISIGSGDSYDGPVSGPVPSSVGKQNGVVSGCSNTPRWTAQSTGGLRHVERYHTSESHCIPS